MNVVSLLTFFSNTKWH